MITASITVTTPGSSHDHPMQPYRHQPSPDALLLAGTAESHGSTMMVRGPSGIILRQPRQRQQ
ncbi:hypothetical protein IG631_22554 [Alternaria alternata]|nr:hypothetical protein IG631_22554 [Alternaria alternata]